MSSPKSDQVISLLCQRLASLRKELVSFALTYLSSDEASQFHLHTQKVVQQEAFEVSEALRRRFVPIPRYCRFIRPGSIYHSPWMSARMAEALYQAGFYQTSVKFHGFCPLMTVDLECPLGRQDIGGILDLVEERRVGKSVDQV